jgi:hypothetical protein
MATLSNLVGSDIFAPQHGQIISAPDISVPEFPEEKPGKLQVPLSIRQGGDHSETQDISPILRRCLN